MILAQIFKASTLSEDKFWVGVGSIVTTIALLYTITRNIRLQNHDLRNLKSALAVELTTNIDSIFSGGVDRPLLFDAINMLRRKHMNRVKDRYVLGQFQKLYLELQDYERFVEKVYLTSGIDSRYVTERQLQKCNIFLGYFGHDEIDYNPNRLPLLSGIGYIQGKRDDAVKIKNASFSKWAEKINLEVQKLLGKSLWERLKHIKKGLVGWAVHISKNSVK